MRRLLTLTFALILSVAATGCTDDAFTPPQNGVASSEASGPAAERSDHQTYPAFLTGYVTSAVATANHAKSMHSDFASPLFGLATASNGDILVADAGAGIATLGDHTDIALPGVSDMSPLGRRALWAIEGLTGEPGDDTGQGLYRVSNGKNRLIADLFDFEADNNPDGAAVDSNPFDVQSLGGQAALVVEAGGNTLLQVTNQGNVEVLAVFPDELVSTANIKDLIECPNSDPLCGLPPMTEAQAVPTSIAVGTAGYYYVGELKGFPAPTGASNIWKVAPNASGATCPNPDCMKVFDGGFTSIIDLAFGAEGLLYVLELDDRSWFAVEVGNMAGGTINACDIATGACTEVATGIPIPTALTFRRDGTLWHTQNALIPGLADVVSLP